MPKQGEKGFALVVIEPGWNTLRRDWSVGVQLLLKETQL